MADTYLSSVATLSLKLCVGDILPRVERVDELHLRAISSERRRLESSRLLIGDSAPLLNVGYSSVIAENI